MKRHWRMDPLPPLPRERKPPRPLSLEQAESTRRPRRCNVPWHRQGGTLVCDLCTNQQLTAKHCICLSSDEPPLFRPRPYDRLTEAAV